MEGGILYFFILNVANISNRPVIVKINLLSQKSKSLQGSHEPSGDFVLKWDKRQGLQSYLLSYCCEDTKTKATYQGLMGSTVITESGLSF